MHLMAQEVLFHIRPSFADAFSCKAGECRHSCCKGWEIDIDDRSLSLYRQLPGTWRERMNAAVSVDESGAHFVLTTKPERILSSPRRMPAPSSGRTACVT